MFFLLRNSLVFWGVFCLFSWVFKGSQGEKILGVFEVFLGIFEKTKEKKDRVRASFNCLIVGQGSGAFSCQGSGVPLRM